MDEQTLSMALYYAFECKEDTCFTEQVTKRAFILLFNNLDNVRHMYGVPGLGPEIVVPAGSLYEGTYLTNCFPLPGCSDSEHTSDINLMFVPIACEVYPDGKNCHLHKDHCIHLTKSRHTRPGYCLARPVDLLIFNMDNVYHYRFQKAYKGLCNVNSTSVSGPAYQSHIPINHKTQNDYYVPKEELIAFIGEYWPNQCRHWPDSRKNCWPSKALQEDIKKEGFHIVKVGHPLSPEKDKEWRYSFSVAEGMLIETFNPTQLKCAVIMKLLVNHYIKPKAPDTICSYHIKTLMLWSVENNTTQIWEPQFLTKCLETLLANLLQCILLGTLPHYFIPDNNLFLNKITDYNREYILGLVKEIRVSLVDKLITLLGLKNDHCLTPSEFQLKSLTNTAFNRLRNMKGGFELKLTQQMYEVIRSLLLDFTGHSTKFQTPFRENVKKMVDFITQRFPTSSKEPHAKFLAKFLCYFQTWCGSICISFSKSKCWDITEIQEKNLETFRSSQSYIVRIGEGFLSESWNASTTGCIKMALVHMSNGNNYQAVPLLNRALNIIDQLQNYGIHAVETKHNFSDFMHLYNDEKAIEQELLADWLNDKILTDTHFIGLEMNILPSLLQLEFTNTFYKTNTEEIFGQYVYPVEEKSLFQVWNPIPLTHFLLFLCHLSNKVTCIEAKYLMGDLQNLVRVSSLTNRGIICESVLNMFNWCTLKLLKECNFKCLILGERIIKTVTLSKLGMSQSLFSHLLVQHVLCVVLQKQPKCSIS